MNIGKRVGNISIGSIFVAALISLVLVCGCDPKSATNEPKETPTAVTPLTNAPAEVVEAKKPAIEDICLAAQNARIPVIMYHDIVKIRTKSSVWYDCSLDEFQEQMATIAQKGFIPISVKDLYEHLSSGKAVPEKAIVLTFDDNYQGFYDVAWPILKQNKYPAMMFVHSGYVGNTEGLHPKMSWATLKELIKDPLFTVGGHTITHPLDLNVRPSAEQTKELKDSKEALEKNLGITVDFLAYPNGSNSVETQQISRDLGYKMAFTIVNTQAEESPNIMAVGRYIHTRLDTALEDREKSILGAPAAIAKVAFKDEKVSYIKKQFAGVELRFIKGGHPKSVSSAARETVQEFVAREGAVAGVNGGFFAMAAIASDDNRMVGPLKTPDMPTVTPDDSPERWEKIRNRPLVMWSEKEFAIVPYQPDSMRDNDQFTYFLPGVTDVLMGGVWLVHGGEARSKLDQSVFAAKDIQDPRRRAWMGITKAGEFIAGAASESVSSAKLAEALAEAGAEEAILLDSGFSTSVVFDGKVKASGHSSADKPSRPIPHAIVVLGEKDPLSKDTEDLKTGSPGGESKKKRKKRRPHAPKPTETVAPDPAP